MKKHSSVLFLTLSTFSLTGGIEKLCRVAGKALNEICDEYESDFNMYSLHDSTLSGNANKYFEEKKFRGFDGSIKKFIWACISKKRNKNNIVLLSHINILIVGYLIKLISPGTKLYLFAHGIEIWPRLSLTKRIMLKKCDLILAVSNFTKDKVIESNQIHEYKFKILNNCLDPFLPEVNKAHTVELKNRYNLNNKKVMIAVTRLSNKEKYKGYDQVIKSMNELIKDIPNLHYLLVGKYDNEEKERLILLIKDLGLNNYITLTGFIEDFELAEHFDLADIYVMPSEKEGFGIVFIEALHYGLPVIAGNRDGSADALLNGKLGTLVNPDSIKEITLNIRTAIFSKKNIPNSKLLQEFAYTTYKNKLLKILGNN